MYERLTQQVPLFREDVPWTPRAAVVLLVVGWFEELNAFLALARFMFGHFHPVDGQRAGMAMIWILIAAWLLLNGTLVTGLTWRRNWARIIELALTLLAMTLILNLSAFLWARRLKESLPTRLRESVTKQNSKLVHG